jgi:DtxR family Mn-dependent transcriptional regulator
MPRLKQTRSVEDFLKSVYSLQQKSERVSTNALAEVLSISPPSVTDMARRLESAGLVDYRKYYGVRLTDDGMAIALRVVRRHRLIELYLVNELGYDLHEVHEEAERLEHAVSDRFVTAISDKLDNPSVDPHGDPIPAADGTITRRDLISLTELTPHTLAVVSRFLAEGDDMLQHMLTKGLKLGAQVEIISRDPFDGPLMLNVDETETILGYNVAAAIMVEVTGE